jgi:hypothetical protein
VLHVESEYLAVLAAEETPAPVGPVAPEVTGYDPYDDPFAVPDGRTWQPDNLDDFATEEAAEPELIRVGGVMLGADGQLAGELEPDVESRCPPILVGRGCSRQL